MRILLTGADGFTGKHFTDIAMQHEVVALKANLNDTTALNAEVKAVAADAVVHLAAISFVGHDTAEDFYRVNTIGTDNLLKAIAETHQTPRVLVASSANVYGNPSIDVIDENVPTAPVNHYAASKLAMEHMTRTWFEKMPIVITRPFNYTGVGQHDSFLIPKIVSHFKRKQTTIELGNLDVSRDFSDVRDVAAAYLQLIESNVHSETINICSGKATALKTIIEKLNNLAGYEINVRVNPAFVRQNEIKQLSGSNALLNRLIDYKTSYSLDDTLSAMYQ